MERAKERERVGFSQHLLLLSCDLRCCNLPEFVFLLLYSILPPRRRSSTSLTGYFILIEHFVDSVKLVSIGFYIQS